MLMQFRRNETPDWWDEISNKERISIENGIKQADNDELIPHSKVKELYVKWLQNLLGFKCIRRIKGHYRIS